LLYLAPAVALASEDGEAVGTVAACGCCVILTISSKATNFTFQRSNGRLRSGWLGLEGQGEP